jgi:AmmeMemoRadiSam system protein A
MEVLPMHDLFTDEDKHTMLDLARLSIRSRLFGETPEWPACNAALQERHGAFVTLHARGNLRGCIGHMNADTELCSLVRSMALAAAFEDPRFLPLSRPEYDDILLEISVLTPFEPCAPEDVEPGVHGVYLTRGFRSGVFLPQVAPEQGWDRQQLLDNLCHKAGLEPGAHSRPDARLFRFTAIVFGET